MGLFSKKKVEEKEELPPLKFPEFQKEPVEEYESPIIPPKEEVKRPVTPPNFMIPIRKPMQPRREEEHFREERHRFEERPRMEERNFRPQRERTLFVKVEKYREIQAKMNEIKAKISESERVLQKLSEVRSQEEHELREWQEDMSKLKDQLIAIDRTLFE